MAGRAPGSRGSRVISLCSPGSIATPPSSTTPRRRRRRRACSASPSIPPWPAPLSPKAFTSSGCSQAPLAASEDGDSPFLETRSTRSRPTDFGRRSRDVRVKLGTGVLDGEERLGPIRRQVGVERVDEQRQETVVPHDQAQLDHALPAELLERRLERAPADTVGPEE